MVLSPVEMEEQDTPTSLPAEGHGDVPFREDGLVEKSEVGGRRSETDCGDKVKG